MRSRIGLILPAVFLLAACIGKAPATSPVGPPAQTPLIAEQIPTTQVSPTNSAGGITPVGTAVADCATGDANKIGESIASSYSFTTTEEVMTWFCQGAEFEDILTALETEEITGTAAEDMLQMRAEGLTWDEIWQVVGLTVK